MFNVKTAKGISEFFYSLDILCRKDLSFSMITSENDYVSRLITHIRFPFGPFKKGFGRFFTRVLRKGEEKLLWSEITLNHRPFVRNII